jgi:hypothetical protein
VTILLSTIIQQKRGFPPSLELNIWSDLVVTSMLDNLITTVLSGGPGGDISKLRLIA